MLFFYWIAAFTALEQQLEQLGHRWANVCLWAESRWIALQDTLQETIRKRLEFAEKYNNFCDWLMKTDTMLSKMPLIKNSDFHQISEQIRCLKVTEDFLKAWSIYFYLYFTCILLHLYNASYRTNYCVLVDQRNCWELSTLQECYCYELLLLLLLYYA